MVERREGTTTEGRGLGHSFAADNVERGDPDVKFSRRRPTYPWGDNPRGREMDWANQRAEKNTEIFRAYRGLVPIEGQKYDDPKRFLRVGSTLELRPDLPRRSPDFAALDAAKERERALLESTNFQALFPSVTFASPSPGATFMRGTQMTIEADASDFRGIHSITLFVDETPVDRRVLDRRDQESIQNKRFIFLYDIPSDRNLGAMSLTVRVFNIETAAQGFIASGATTTTPEIDKAVGTLDGRVTVYGNSPEISPQIEKTGFLRTPEGTASITVNITA